MLGQFDFQARGCTAKATDGDSNPHRALRDQPGERQTTENADGWGKYAVVIKDLEARQRLTFERRYYTLRSKERALVSSLQRFITEVVGPLRMAVSASVYIRGMADEDSYDGPLEVGFEYDSLTYRREKMT